MHRLLAVGLIFLWIPSVLGAQIHDTGTLDKELLALEPTTGGVWPAARETLMAFKREQFRVVIERCSQLLSAEKNPNRRAFLLECRGDAYLNLEQYDRGMSDFDAAVKIRPTVGSVHSGRAYVLQVRRQDEAAIKEYNLATKLDPNCFPAYDNRALLYRKKGEFDKAISDYSASLKLDVRDVDGYAGRAVAYCYSGKIAEAQRDLAQANRFLYSTPNPEAALNEIAWLRATCPADQCRNGPEAVQKGKKACDLSHWARPYVIDTLAAAHAENGDFARAVQYEQQALNMKNLDPSSRADFQRRLESFKQRKPWRDLKR